MNYVAPLLNMGNVWVLIIGGPIFGILSFFAVVYLEAWILKRKFKFAKENHIRNSYIANGISLGAGILMAFFWSPVNAICGWFFAAYFLTVLIETVAWLWLLRLKPNKAELVIPFALLANAASYVLLALNPFTGIYLSVIDSLRYRIFG